MIKTIILLVIVFYTFPCWKINAQSRDTSNIFAGYYIAVYNKSDLSHKKIRRHHKHSYNTAIDSRYRTYFIPIKIGKNNINQENIWKEVTDNKKESDTIFIFPDSTDIKLFKQIGLIDSNISDKKHLLLQEIKSLPYYNTASNKAYLFKCLYVKGTFLQLRIDTIDKNWQDYLLDIYSISTKKKKKLLLVTGIDSLHSIKSDGTSIQARPYIKTGQQKPCTALIVGNWFAGEEGYIRKEALLEQGEPFVSWIRCNDCPQIRFNESDSGSVVYPGPPVSWNDPSNPDDPQAGYGYIPNDTTKEETFFYHSDHLGSTSYITDDKANITQYDAYLPYGELLVDEHSSSEDLPYKFNGKQFDEETGLYYYGARYMNPITSLWYGVDPLAEKYLMTGAYVYCGDNPIVLKDPDGRGWIQTKKGIYYNPSIHSQKDISVRDARRGFKYLGETYQNDKRGISYRNDGSILFRHESDAYNHMWNNANNLYKVPRNPQGKEVGGFLLSNGSVLVLPDYNNDSRTTKMDAGGYTLNNRLLTKGKERFTVVAQVHTHQDTSGEASPSVYLIDSYGDLGYSKNNNSLPVFTIGHDGRIYGIRGYTDKGQVTGVNIRFKPRESSRRNLLNGNTSLYRIIMRLPKLRD